VNLSEDFKMTIPTLGGIELTGCEQIRPEKTANIIPIPIPTEDSDKTEVFDMLGVVKMISIVGTFAEGTISNTRAKVNAFEALIDGNQDVIEFISDQTGTITGMIASSLTVWDLPGFKCTYEVKFIQGKYIG